MSAEDAHKLGLHPIDAPLGDNHHTDVPFAPEDSAMGEALGWYLGGMYIDVQSPCDGGCYLYTKMTSVDEWTRVARALRIHGLKIVDA